MRWGRNKIFVCRLMLNAYKNVISESFYILWQVDPLLCNDPKRSNYKTAAASQWLSSDHPNSLSSERMFRKDYDHMGSGVWRHKELIGGKPPVVKCLSV